VRMGTRGSRLAMAQARWVAARIAAGGRTSEPEPVVIRTRGDADSRPLFAIDQKGIFEREIDERVASGGVDFAVHSMKDVPTELPDGLVLACVPRRAAAGDVLVTRDGSGIASLREGATVGTSSLRRAVQVRRARPGASVRPVRGNVDTRVSRVGRGDLDAVVLARAGLERLGMDGALGACGARDLPRDEFVPSPGQGALALVARADDAPTIEALRSIEDAASRAEAEAERALSEAIGSGCRFPVGALAVASEGRVSLRAAAYSVDGAERLDAEASGDARDARAVGARAGAMLLERGVGRLAFNWREGLAGWNSR